MKILKFLILCVFLFECKSPPINCNEINISIENRWNEYNGGKRKVDITNKEDKIFICKRISKFSKGKEVRIAHNYGYFEIQNNYKSTEMIFTYKYGIVYRVSPGRYVYDEALTKKILEIMEIKNRCWEDDCAKFYVDYP
jgi:hypothetical protein